MFAVLPDMIVAAFSVLAVSAFTSLYFRRRRTPDWSALDSMPGSVYQRLLAVHIAFTSGLAGRRLD